MDRRAFTVLVLAAATVATAGVVTAGGASVVLLGNQVVEAGRDANPPGSAEAFRTTATVTGTVAKLTVYVDTGSTATRLVAGLYADASGHPGALLGQGALTAPTANAWNDVPLPGVAVTAGTAYWIAVLGPSGTLRFRDRCCGSGSPAEVHAGTGLSALPAAWATGATYRDGPLAAYGSSVDSSPVLVVTPGTLSFAGVAGGPAPATKTIGIANGGAGTITWSATTSAPWLGISPAGGTAPGNATVSASTTGLAVGTYSGSVSVTASGAQGSPQTVSVSLSVTAAPDTQPPSAPSNLVATATGSSIGLTWGASTDTVGVTRYDVHRSATTGFTPSAGTLIGQTTTAITYTDPAVAVGTWYYRVLAYDAAGNASDPSNQASATVSGTSPPNQIGDWSAPTTWPIVAVHMSLLPTGNVLAFDAWEDAPNTQRIWYPSNGSFTSVPYGSNLFCAGHVLLPDGRTMIVGGHVQADVGIRDTSLFDAGTNTWSKAADMSVTRWYPTATVLGDGKVFVFAGDAIVDRGLPFSPTYLKEASQNSLPSVYDPAANSWNDLTGARLTTPLYPFLFQLPDGRILNAGPDPTTRVMTPGTWAWSTIATSPFDGGSAVTYLPGKVMKSGAYANTDYYGTSTLPSHARTAVLDATQASPTWRETAPMQFPRSYHNQTLLPDGTVLASGGTSTSDGVDDSKAVLPAEIWNPQTETWTTVDSLATPRGYHSTALLLPDGRVLMAGGGQLPNRATNNRTGEIYSPPYLFKGARPAITTAPSLVEYGTSFTIVTPDAASIQKVALIRTPSVTHAFDENQRYVPLTFTRGAGNLSVQAPANGNLAPPGYYMLFILNGDGVPSLAPFVRFPAPLEDTEPPTAPADLTATPGTPGTVTANWTAATDNKAVTVYNVYRSTTSGFTPSPTNRIARPSGTSYADSGLAAGTYYYVVKAEDAAGNLGAASNQATAIVAPSGDTTPPMVSISAPGAGSTVTGAIAVSATASDAVGVAGVQFRLDGQALGAEDTTAPYSVSWATATATNGAHTLTAVARDAAANSATSAPVGVTVQNTTPPPTTFLLGDQGIAAQKDSNGAGVAEAFQTTASVTGTVRRLNIYTDTATTATSVVVGLYSDSAGRPGALLASGSIAAPISGAWGNVTVPATAVTAGTRYWIAVLAPSGAGIFRFRDRGTGGIAETSAQTTLATLPATWTTGQRYTDGPLSGYGSGSVP